MLNMSTITKQKLCSQAPYNSFPNDFYRQQHHHHHHHHHRQSTASSENEQLSPRGDNIAESVSTSNFISPPSATDGGGKGGWYGDRLIQNFYYLNYLFIEINNA